MDVLGGQILILKADIPKCRGQIRLSHFHINLHMLIMYLGLQLSNLLQASQRGKLEFCFFFKNAQKLPL